MATIDSTPEKPDPDIAAMIEVASPADQAHFRKYLALTQDLRKLPKAQLHIHSNSCIRNGQVKSLLKDFNQNPEAIARLAKMKSEMEAKAADGDERSRKMLPIVSGTCLCLPEIFWEADGSLKSSAYDLADLDKVCPWSGLTGWNPPDNLWHGMGGCRDYGLVQKLLQIDIANLDYWVAASEDALSEGIRWVEYCGCGQPQATIEPAHTHATAEAEDSAEANAAQAGSDTTLIASALTISETAYKEWRDPLLARWKHVTSKVPQVGITYIFVPDMDAEWRAAYASAFAKWWSEDKEMQEVVKGFGEVGAANPALHSEAYAIYIKAGLVAVNVHVGEWSPAPDRQEMCPAALERVKDALELGVKRIGHGIIAHRDPELMARLQQSDICLEICPTSNRILDNVPDGLQTHPLRRLFDAHVPCALGSDDPGHCGAVNGQGLVREFLVARQCLNFTNSELAQLAKNSFIYSLAPEELKNSALAAIDQWKSSSIE
eukprot:TRINITY_DN64673_c0_g1_i1.p1 TRINITY_DN64673_c0_g1~~TRINITY_DN64673_c0_g1_i1.p1  ORF type:complete len:490 (-),score=93.61 TRINITY_DN64673_c0_g1_i1:348-1817(-)